MKYLVIYPDDSMEVVKSTKSGIIDIRTVFRANTIISQHGEVAKNRYSHLGIPNGYTCIGKNILPIIVLQAACYLSHDDRHDYVHEWISIFNT